MEVGGNPNKKTQVFWKKSNWVQSSASLKEKAEKYISLHML